MQFSTLIWFWVALMLNFPPLSSKDVGGTTIFVHIQSSCTHACERVACIFFYKEKYVCGYVNICVHV
jgi:hypothetical protein